MNSDKERGYAAGIAGKSYRPSNGTEGDIFMAKFCNHCKSGQDCRILMLTMCYSEHDPEYPKEWIYEHDNIFSGKCTAFEDVK